MPNVIEIENLYKEYRLGLIGYGTLREDFQSWWAKFRGKDDPNSIVFSGNNSGNIISSDHILALNDINLEVKAGERLGIIGANGAGKTTLLKILSRIAAPTRGVAKIKGRVASLIAVGTGFHSELTGRENIYLNGSILGLRKREIDECFDEIVEFAGFEQFIDTPVKRYSSGMYVRLGFAVAAHLDPDVLIVDEVLAVGDADFRKKALGKMKEVSTNEGRTILFVSHNMDAINILCDRAILLESGKIVDDGLAENVVSNYLASTFNDVATYSGERVWSEDNTSINNIVVLRAIRTKNGNGEICGEFDVTEPVKLEIDYQVLIDGYQLCAGVHFVNNKDEWLFYAPDDYVNSSWGKQPTKKIGIHRATYTVPGNLFQDGTIKIHVGIFPPPAEPSKASSLVNEKNIFTFSMIDSFNKNGVRGNYPFNWGSPALRPAIECNSKFLGDL